MEFPLDKFSLQKINGILSLLGNCNDFQNDYEKMVSFNPFRAESKFETRFGVISSFENDKNLIVPVGYKSFLNLTHVFRKQIREIPSCYGLFNVLSAFYEVNFVCAIVYAANDGPEDNRLFWTYIVTEKNGKLFCGNAIFSDILALSKSITLPIFFNKKIIEENTISSKEIEKRIIEYDK